MRAREAVTLGILAGGQGSRLGGIDKAWLTLDGEPQVLRVLRRLGDGFAGTLVSANRNLARFASHGLVAVPDPIAGIGPMGGLDALAAACSTPWLMTVPVDLPCPDGAARLSGVVATLAAAGRDGAVVEDDEGLQPLIALYRRDALREALAGALASGTYAVRALQAAMGLASIRFEGMRFGNLNRPEDLRVAGYRHE